MTPDERMELEEMLPILLDDVDENYARATKWRSRALATSHETEQIVATRLAVATAFSSLGTAFDAYRETIKRALR